MPQVSTKKTKSRVSSGVSKVLDQARESLKLLDALEKETLEKAKIFVRNPLQAERRKKASNEKILSKLSAIGIATRSEVKSLENQILDLNQKLEILQLEISSAQTKAKTKAKPSSKNLLRAAEAFPNT